MYARHRPFTGELSLVDAKWTRAPARVPCAPYRSRKPVWAFRSIGGSNPPLSASPAYFSLISRGIDWSRPASRALQSGSTQASSGQCLWLVVPSPFPRALLRATSSRVDARRSRCRHAAVRGSRSPATLRASSRRDARLPSGDHRCASSLFRAAFAPGLAPAHGPHALSTFAATTADADGALPLSAI
jgi:hypothetical protein